jgi:nucleotide-binding universal stress UspA family protein
MQKPIVVAVDGAEPSLRAAEWAAREAVRRAAALRVVAAPGQPPCLRTDGGSAVMVANALRGMAARALADAVERVAEVAPEAPVETALLDGPPTLAVADNANGGQLLVVGSRDGDGLPGWVLGSVSRYLAANAPCPVAVVGEQAVTVFDPADPARGPAEIVASRR